MVRIGFVSDLHVDFNRRHDFISILTELVAKKHLDRLVIMGDTANGLERNLAFDDQLAAKLPVPFQTLIGNHDLYVDHPRQKTVGQIQRASREAYRQLNQLPFSLTQHPLETAHWVITGINGWYDDTFASHFTEQRGPKLATNWIARHVWPDQLYINGNQIDYYRDRRWVISQIFDWQHQINQLTLGNRKLLVAMHMLPTKKLVKSLPIPFYDRFLYQLGSERYREIFEQNHVSRSLSGHSHMPKIIRYRGIDYQNISLGYDFQWQDPADALGELERVMFILED